MGQLEACSPSEPDICSKSKRRGGMPKTIVDADAGTEVQSSLPGSPSLMLLSLELAALHFRLMSSQLSHTTW